jgi:hypothetical protein
MHFPFYFHTKYFAIQILSAKPLTNVQFCLPLTPALAGKHMIALRRTFLRAVWTLVLARMFTGGKILQQHWAFGADPAF